MLGIILASCLLILGGTRAMAHNEPNCQECIKERKERPTKETDKKKKFCNVVYRTNPKCKLR